MMQEQIIETWQIHNRINLYLLEAVSPEHLSDVSASKGRTVGEQFSHIHNVRLMWLKSAAPELLENLHKLGDADKAQIKEGLEQSSKTIEKLLQQGLETGKIKGFKPHAVAFLGYLISHESHHRGQIALTLKQAGHPLDKKIAFGLWEWGVR
jgi:uncharacterized damage-inducible protein DinB